MPYQFSMLKVIRLVFGLLRKPKLSRVGFTLVELLVVIGIIAILAGVALGPITSGIKKANQSKGLQTAHVLALAEFQYANDNNQSYPDTGTTGNIGKGDASDVAACLMSGGYVGDPGIFVINGSAEANSKYTGSLTSINGLTSANISWDFAGNAGNASGAGKGSGVNSNFPDTMPLVWSSTAGGTEPDLTNTGPTTVTLNATMPFGTAGIAVCYKSNSASFIVAPGSTSKATIVDATFPGAAIAVLKGGG